MKQTLSYAVIASLTLSLSHAQSDADAERGADLIDAGANFMAGYDRYTNSNTYGVVGESLSLAAAGARIQMAYQDEGGAEAVIQGGKEVLSGVVATVTKPIASTGVGLPVYVAVNHHTSQIIDGSVDGLKDGIQLGVADLIAERDRIQANDHLDVDQVKSDYLAYKAQLLRQEREENRQQQELAAQQNGQGQSATAAPERSLTLKEEIQARYDYIEGRLEEPVGGSSVSGVANSDSASPRLEGMDQLVTREDGTSEWVPVPANPIVPKGQDTLEEFGREDAMVNSSAGSASPSSASAGTGVDGNPATNSSTASTEPGSPTSSSQPGGSAGTTTPQRGDYSSMVEWGKAYNRDVLERAMAGPGQGTQRQDVESNNNGSPPPAAPRFSWDNNSGKKSEPEPRKEPVTEDEKIERMIELAEEVLINNGYANYERMKFLIENGMMNLEDPEEALRMAKLSATPEAKAQLEKDQAELERLKEELSHIPQEILREKVKTIRDRR